VRTTFFFLLFLSFDLWATVKAKPCDTYFSDKMGKGGVAGNAQDFLSRQIYFQDEKDGGKWKKPVNGPWR